MHLKKTKREGSGMNEKTKKMLKWIGLTVLSFVILSFLTGPYFAFILMFMIGLHESGHLLAAKCVGAETRGFWFVPLFGGAALIDTNQPEQWKKYVIAFGGPFVGFLLCIFALEIWAIGRFNLFNLSPETREIIIDLMRQTVPIWAMINIFNLFPVYPMDGGRIVASLSLKRTVPSKNEKLFIKIISWLTIVLLAILVFFVFSPFSLLWIAGLAIFFRKHIGRLEPYYRVSPPLKWHEMAVGWIAYICLVVILFICMFIPFF